MSSTFKHEIDPTALREYDIRGIVGETLHYSDAYAIGIAFGSMVMETGGRRVAVGFDGRLTSPDLEAELVRGLLASGADVVRIGCGPSPMLYFAATTLDVHGGIMVTGSHNPAEYNGFKMKLGKEPFFGRQIQELGARAAKGLVTTAAVSGQITNVDIVDDYVGRLAADWDGGTTAFNVVWDSGNGAAGHVLERLVARMPGQHTIINGEIDGTFPAHHPDPTVASNLEQLILEVRTRGADIGIAFDGDADRIGAVDNHGNILAGDQLLVIMARDILRGMPGATIIADVKASQVFFDEVTAAGGNPLMWRTGHSLIKTKMTETGSPLAGEMSGHMFFADKYYGYDDALYAAVRLLGTLARSGRTLSDIHDALPKVMNTPELRFDCDDRRKFGVVADVAARLREIGASVSNIDGVRVSTDDGWWLLRASNTQSVLVARAESATPDGLERLKSELTLHLVASGLDAPDFSGDHAGH